MTARSFTFDVTCGDCGSDLEVDKLTSARQTRRAGATCTSCGERWVITVSMAKPISADRTPVGGPRLPWAPLARHLPASPTDIAETLGIHIRTFHHYRNDGIPAELADSFAVAAGVLPVNVWGSAYYVALGVEAAA